MRCPRRCVPPTRRRATAPSSSAGSDNATRARGLSGPDGLPAPLRAANRTSRHGDILQRRIRHRDECVRWMAQITDEIEGIDQLIRLIIQRTACPVFDLELGREIDRRLWELDEVDAAMHQLSA